jgi:hypothetical protein
MKMTLKEAVIKVLEENEIDENTTTNTLTLENILPEAETGINSHSKTPINPSKKKGSSSAPFAKTGSFKKTSI